METIGWEIDYDFFLSFIEMERYKKFALNFCLPACILAIKILIRIAEWAQKYIHTM
jgi:hypothetical protein